MDKQSICAFLTIKERSAQAIPNEFVDVLDPDAISSSTITKLAKGRAYPVTCS
jgi:hypothetical protein